jgi:hypothetical protein
LIGFLEFHEAVHRLLARRHGKRALQTAVIYKSLDDGRLRLEFPDAGLTYDEYRAATDAFVWSLRAGDNVAVVEIDGIPQRVSLWHWYPYPQPDELSGLILKNPDGRPILIDEERFEAWLIGSGVLEAQPAGEVISGDQKAVATPRRPKAGYELDDEHLLREMAYLMKSRGCSSVWAAAKRVADEAKGNALHESKAKRLHRRFPEWFQKFSESETE